MAGTITKGGALGALAALGALVGPATGGAQVVRAPDPNAARVMVAVMRSAERNLGVQAADAIRSKLTNDLPYRQVWVIPKQDINNTLEASGFSTTEALLPHDAKALATLLRADEYIAGGVVKTETGFRAEPVMVLARDNSLVQPLGSFEAPKLDGIASQISKEVSAARKQLQYERKCVNFVREGKVSEAMAEAQKGVAEYPKATLTRICMLNILDRQKASPDSIIALGREIVAIDPLSKPALIQLSQAYKAKKDEDNYLKTLTELLAADPTNLRLQQQVVEELAASGKAKLAVPIIAKIVEANPGDPELMKLQWLVLLAAKEYRTAAGVGEEMVKVDTALATADYFTRLAAAFAADSQPQKAQEAASRGVAKFADNAALWQVKADAERKAGQPQQAIESQRKALSIDGKLENGWLQIAQIYNDLEQADSAMAAVKQAVSAGNDKALAGGLALQVADKARRKAAASKKLDEFRAAASLIKSADEVVPTDLKGNAAFLAGANNLQFGAQALTEAREAKNCALIKEAQTALTDAQQQIAAGGRTNPQTAGQLMGMLGQVMPFGEQLAKAICK
jgi:tetratricopeptide (TPR) repeat protein